MFSKALTTTLYVGFKDLSKNVFLGFHLFEVINLKGIFLTIQENIFTFIIKYFTKDEFYFSISHNARFICRHHQIKTNYRCLRGSKRKLPDFPIPKMH